MGIEVHSASDAAFDTIAARVSGDQLVIRTPNQYISMFWFVMVVVIAALTGLYVLGYPWGMTNWIWCMPILLASVVLIVIRMLASHNQRVEIRRGTVSIMTQIGRKWVTVKTIPVADITAIKIGITGNAEVVSTEVAVGSTAVGFLSVATLGVGWITTVSQTSEVAIFFLHIVTKKQDHVLSLMNYSRSASDQVLLKIQEFFKQGLAN